MSVLKFKIKYFLLILLWICRSSLFAQKSNVPEYQVKAVCIFNFTQFVEWPTDALSPEQGPFIIGILGENPFGTYLEEVVSGEKVNGHPITVKYYKNANEIKLCHILFIGKSDTFNSADIILSFKGKTTLTVSDLPYFLQNGGIIRLYTKNNKIQIQINLEAAKTANLIISSKLLKMVEIYTLVKK